MDLDINSDSNEAALSLNMSNTTAPSGTTTTATAATPQIGAHLTSTTLRSAGLLGAEGLVDAVFFQDEQAPHPSVMVGDVAACTRNNPSSAFQEPRTSIYDASPYPFTFMLYDAPDADEVDSLILLALTAQRPIETKQMCAYSEEYRNWFVWQLGYATIRALYDRGEPLCDIFRWLDHVLGAEVEAANTCKSVSGGGGGANLQSPKAL